MSANNNTYCTNSSGKFPQPWGVFGLGWRVLLFFAVMVLLVWIFMLLEKCENGFPDPYADNRDTSIVRDWNDSIPDVVELPSPDSNFVPIIDTNNVVINPDDSLTTIIDDQLIVFFNSKDVVADITSFARQFKAAYPGDEYAVVYYNTTAGSMILHVPTERLTDIMDELYSKITGIDFVVATNEIMKDAGVPSDKGFADRHNDEYFRLIQAYDAWDITQGSDSVVVAIVDTYFDLTNPEIGKRYIHPINIPSKRADVFPPGRKPNDLDEVGAFCHGSHVAGIAIGGTENGIGCSGIAPKCKWIPVSISDAESNSMLTSFSCIEGILYAVYRGADVINCSFGNCFPKEFCETTLAEQIGYAVTKRKHGEKLWSFIYKTAEAHNSIIVRAAGNDSILSGCDPENRNPNIIVAEAVDGKGIKAGFSNFGKLSDIKLDYSTVSAPGVGIWSCSDRRCLPIWKKLGMRTSPDGFQEMDGTSMASPVVTGAVALLKSKNKSLTASQIKKILIMTGKQFDTDPEHRIGPVIQIKDALDATSTGRSERFDDLEKDHTKLIGKWKSTEEVGLLDSDGNVVDEIWVYFVFNSDNSGSVEYHTIRSRKVYTANLSVTWKSGIIDITQLTEASDGKDGVAKMDKCELHPDVSGLLEADVSQVSGNKSNFKLEKVK